MIIVDRLTAATSRRSTRNDLYAVGALVLDTTTLQWRADMPNWYVTAPNSGKALQQVLAKHADTIALTWPKVLKDGPQMRHYGASLEEVANRRVIYVASAYTVEKLDKTVERLNAKLADMRASYDAGTISPEDMCFWTKPAKVSFQEYYAVFHYVGLYRDIDD